MTFPTDDIYLGPATFGKRRGTEGFVWHTTEGADASRASAVGTAEWQKRNPGSYNFIIYDGGILLTVPYLEASGGVNPGSYAWSPLRFPFLREGLSPDAFADPNAYLLNVSFSGKTAVFRDQGIPANMIDTAARLTIWAEATFGRRMFHCGHMHWQTNRSDPSQKVLDLIAARYAELTAPPEEPVSILTRPVREKWAIPAGMTFWVGGPGFGERKSFTADIELWSNGETLDGNWRRLEYEDSPGAGEELWADGARRTRKMQPIPGTRNPVTGFGSPEMAVGVPVDSWKALQTQATQELDNLATSAKAGADALRAKTP